MHGFFFFAHLLWYHPDGRVNDSPEPCCSTMPLWERRVKVSSKEPLLRNDKIRLPCLMVQFRSTWKLIGLVFIVSTVLIGAGLFIHFWKGIPISDLTRDLVSIFHGSGAHIYTGVLSQIGIFFWSAAAAICLFSATILSRNPDILKIKRFLAFSGLFTLLLGFDDAFLLHEIFFPYVFGISEEAVLASYAGIILFYLIRYYSIIIKTEYFLLGIALFFFGLSIPLDMFTSPLDSDSFEVEEDLDLVGLVSWIEYFYSTAAFAIYQDIAHQRTESGDISAALSCPP